MVIILGTGFWKKLGSVHTVSGAGISDLVIAEHFNFPSVLICLLVDLRLLGDCILNSLLLFYKLWAFKLLVLMFLQIFIIWKEHWIKGQLCTKIALTQTIFQCSSAIGQNLIRQAIIHEAEFHARFILCDDINISTAVFRGLLFTAVDQYACPKHEA